MSHYNPKTIGVTWSSDTTSMYDRSSWDMKMDNMYNPEYKQCGPPPDSNQYESYRTNFDRKMLADYNPQSNRLHEGYQPRHSKLHDDPYRPWSYLTLQPGMR